MAAVVIHFSIVPDCLLQVSVLSISGPSMVEGQSLMWDRDTATPPRQLAAKHERRTAER